MPTLQEILAQKKLQPVEAKVLSTAPIVQTTEPIGSEWTYASSITNNPRVSQTEGFPLEFVIKSLHNATDCIEYGYSVPGTMQKLMNYLTPIKISDAEERRFSKMFCPFLYVEIASFYKIPIHVVYDAGISLIEKGYLSDKRDG